MADLPDIDDIEENIKLGDEYEHPEPVTHGDECSNLGGIPADVATLPDLEDDDE